MKKSSKLSSIALATSAAALFAISGCANTGTGGAQTASAQGHCMGVNACKGLSGCKTADNACAGQNACKGQGFVSMTKEQCMQVGGEYVADLIG